MIINDSKNLPIICPSCGRNLSVERLNCGNCGTSVEGEFSLPLLAQLSLEEQTVILNLLKSSGSLKDMAHLYGVSYPTIRNRLDALIEKVRALESCPESDEEG